MQEEKSQEECNILRWSDNLLGHSPKWSLSKREAKVDYHEHKTNIEMRSLVSISGHEVNVQNEWK
jgi:hypothetical protein